MSLNPFHLAFQVRDIAEARKFYGNVLGCSEGRSSETWVDFDFFGHQVVCHLNLAIGSTGTVVTHSNPVDGHGVPVPHFGVVLNMETWESLAGVLRKAGIEFVIEQNPDTLCCSYCGGRQVVRQAYGFFRLKILALHESTYALVG